MSTTTRIGPGLIVDGALTGADDLIVQGSLQGEVRVDGNVQVESGGVLRASVHAAAVRVDGEMDGDLAASGRVELNADCRMNGNIRASRILIADGARFSGSVDMND